VAAKSSQEVSTEDVEELLDTVDKTMDRLKTLYEQYFLGIQKQAPAYIHSDIERKLRDLQQLQIRNTGLRYRFVTLQQKFGSYNSYWRRTLRQIENGTYIRNLSKIGREAAKSGAEIPEEILAAMPKRMREQVLRDREQALAAAARRRRDDTLADGDVDVDLDDMPPEATEDLIAMIKEPTDLRRGLKTRGGAHVLDDQDGDLDLEAFFAQIDAEDTGAPRPAVTPPVRQTGPMAAVTPPVRRSAPMTAVDPPREIDDQHPTDRLPPVQRATGPAARPSVPAPARPGTPAPVRPVVPTPARPSPAVPLRAPSQTTRPNPIVPGAAAAHGAVPVESMSGPFPREPSGPVDKRDAARVAIPRPPPTIPKPPPRAQSPRPEPPPPQKPPPGMTDADVNALYAKYVKAKEMVGEKVGPGEHSKLLKTINAQAPKIMEQYKAKAVDFSIVVKDNQVIIRAKPKT